MNCEDDFSNFEDEFMLNYGQQYHEKVLHQWQQPVPREIQHREPVFREHVVAGRTASCGLCWQTTVGCNIFSLLFHNVSSCFLTHSKHVSGTWCLLLGTSQCIRQIKFCRSAWLQFGSWRMEVGHINLMSLHIKRERAVRITYGKP